MLVRAPPVDSGERRETQRFQALRDREVVPPANLLLMRVCRPRVVRSPDDELLDVDEAGRGQHLPRVVLVRDGPEDAVGGVREVLVPLRDGRVRGQGAVVASRLQVDLYLLDASEPGLQMAGRSQQIRSGGADFPPERIATTPLT